MTVRYTESHRKQRIVHLVRVTVVYANSIWLAHVHYEPL